jgi:hypothetical protein
MPTTLFTAKLPPAWDRGIELRQHFDFLKARGQWLADQVESLSAKHRNGGDHTDSWTVELRARADLAEAALEAGYLLTKTEIIETAEQVGESMWILDEEKESDDAAYKHQMGAMP